MNPQLQPRTDPILLHAYPIFALSNFYCPWLRLPAHSANMPKLNGCHELSAQTLSAQANQDHTLRQKQLKHIQRP
jgi:hypothetical protein